MEDLDIKRERKRWTKPNIIYLFIDMTSSGSSPGTPEGISYAS